MDWEKISQHPQVIQNYNLFRETGVLSYIEELTKANLELEELLLKADNIFRKESVEELIDLIIRILSDKFIPSNLTFILNEGILVNRIKVLSFTNMKISEPGISISSLEELDLFFQKYQGTTSFLILEQELADSSVMPALKSLSPEIVVPVLGISGLYGIILFGSKVLGEEYTAKEISYIDRLMRLTSIAIQNTIHYEHSVKDSKTGLYNHNFFIHRLNEQIARSQRDKIPFSVVVLDIDKFKTFNDTYGHLAGDEVILQIASQLKKCVRDGDIISRFGGEEFTLLLAYSGRKEAWIAAERIRTAIEEMVTVYQENTLKVTISIGVATNNPYEYLDSNSLIKRADQALYESKKNGRNRTTHFKSGLLQIADGL